ncbi:MAG TPA: hypothetical protein VKI44_08120 [Acetobacteraceae bacterium]|nr:hypothetical protein [Acetobacteraceae bacterium]
MKGELAAGLPYAPEAAVRRASCAPPRQLWRDCAEYRWRSSTHTGSPPRLAALPWAVIEALQHPPQSGMDAAAAAAAPHAMPWR